MKRATGRGGGGAVFGERGRHARAGGCVVQGAECCVRVAAAAAAAAADLGEDFASCPCLLGAAPSAKNDRFGWHVRVVAHMPCEAAGAGSERWIRLAGAGARCACWRALCAATACACASCLPCFVSPTQQLIQSSGARKHWVVHGSRAASVLGSSLAACGLCSSLKQAHDQPAARRLLLPGQSGPLSLRQATACHIHHTTTPLHPAHPSPRHTHTHTHTTPTFTPSNQATRRPPAPAATAAR